jgi:hypothetical protein
MSDRLSTILASNAAKCMPKLAAFLANETALPPATIEAALRIAVEDSLAGERQARTKDAWSEAVAIANGQFGYGAATPPAAATSHSPAKDVWGRAVASVNAGMAAD